MALQLFLARVCIPSGSHGAIIFIQTAVHAQDWFLAKQLLEAQYGVGNVDRVFGQPAVLSATPPPARPLAPAKPLTPQQQWLKRRPWALQGGTNGSQIPQIDPKSGPLPLK